MGVIQFREEGGKFYVTEPWPDPVEIPWKLINLKQDYLVVDGHTVTICVANGFATYRRREKTKNGWLCRKTNESEFIASKA